MPAVIMRVSLLLYIYNELRDWGKVASANMMVDHHNETWVRGRVRLRVKVGVRVRVRVRARPL